MNSLPDDLGPRLRDSLGRGSAPKLPTDLVTGAADRPAPKLANPRARVQVIGSAAVVVAAVAVAAIVVGSGVGRAPLFTEAASSSANTAAPAALPAHGLFRLWADYVYQAGSDLSTSGGSGDVYQLARSGSGSDRVTALATDFGITNGSATVDNSDPANPLWTIGSTNSTNPSLQVTWSGAGDWWYSNPSADPASVCPPTTDGDGDGSSGSSSGSSGGASSSGGVSTVPACTTVTPPTVPNKAPAGAVARSKAQAIFSETGLDVAANDIRLDSDGTQTTATANLVVGGVKTALDWGVTWSSTGQISSAYGESVAAVDRGSYGTISASDAVARLNNSQWSGEAGPQYQARVLPFAMLGVAPRANAVTGSAPTPGSNADSSADAPTPAPAPTSEPSPMTTAPPSADPTAEPTDTPTVVPTPVATTAPTPLPTPTGPPIIDVTIHTADPTLLLVWDSKGDAWLVPGYAMRVEDELWDSVVSLVPGVIALPPAASVEPVVGAP